MMKRSKLGIAITAFFITFLAVGCSNTSSNNSSNSGFDKYTTYMNQGKDAASSQKYETAEELGLLDKVQQYGWKSLTTRESGKIGGLINKKKRETKKTQSEQSDEK